ncbi:UvrD-helicase domain-containing protein [Desulfovibrio sp. TomC]|uniref:UvrD-helicase domain-containing protein n=1 Tax=Desulfovibrio sp. TomC TaxID=1562888 RepID=UPI000574C64B|nr:UvrD-helicase domain-containing protein [Desulfovibrio sp. TomC]KHK00209.1 ATP-dependent DNA helicase UvrD/PcrA [Desulfovibrio sp. TomC]
MLEITDEDITLAEAKLLPPGCSFDEERRAFIRSLYSCDVIACPGSGKTTALLAKLLILGKKVSFLKGGGICVLTHTNVAINEIKKRLGDEADKLLSYPNFFGTIQSFVDRYLASPCFIKLFNKRLTAIDTEYYLHKLTSECMASRARPWISKQVQGPGYDSPSDLLKKIQLDSSTLTFDLKPIKLANTTTITHIAITHACKKIFESGIISHRQAYNLAKYYLQNHPALDDLFSARFKFVLIDEMQDSYGHQIDILDALFSGPRSVVQKLGDPNQAIFSTPTDSEMEWRPRDGALTFSRSMRFGQNISTVASKVRTLRHIPLLGNDNVNSHKPHIITYNDFCMDCTIQSFGKLIRNLGLDEDASINNKVFKAIGWVGKQKETTCIPHYWQSYTPHKKNIAKFCSFRSYIKSYEGLHCGAHSPKIFQRLLYEGIANLVNRCNTAEGIPFTAHQFKNWLKTNNSELYLQINSTISQWFLEYLLGKSEDKIIDEATVLLDPLIAHCSDKGMALDFISSTTIDDACQQDFACNFVDCISDIQIEVGTVHSAKGETHTATLFLSTFYHKDDIKYITPFLLEKPVQRTMGVRLKSCIKISHVAMSRPTHLFAMACHENNIADYQSEFSDNGWVIVSVESLMT